jgi:hypothetical protein
MFLHPRVTIDDAPECNRTDFAFQWTQGLEKIPVPGSRLDQQFPRDAEIARVELQLISNSVICYQSQTGKTC